MRIRCDANNRFEKVYCVNYKQRSWGRNSTRLIFVKLFQVPPRFLKKPQDKTELANKDIELECSVYGRPEPKISWFKNGEVINSNEYYQIVNGYY